MEREKANEDILLKHGKEFGILCILALMSKE
jgi:hypothetical protein